MFTQLRTRHIFKNFPYLRGQFLDLFATARHNIIRFIDFFHRPFVRFIPVQTFRYLACGGSNTVLNIFLEFVSINYILHRSPAHIAGMTIAPEVGAWIIANGITLPTGFILSRHVVYPESNLHSRIQAFRYALTTIFFIVLTYLLIKLFAYAVPSLNPTISYTFVCIFITFISYVTQRLFTFKVKPEEVLAE